MTISDAAPFNWPPRADIRGQGGADPAVLLGAENAVDFAIGSAVSPAEAMDRAVAMTALALPRLLDKAHVPADACSSVEAVVTELVDVTARHQASADLVARLAYDGAHFTVSVGDMARALPAPEEEPGLYLVHRVAAEVGQYAGDHGGRVTWAAVPARLEN
ncbi:hypothetical protein [Streptomyces longispororuber]|uniref:hypothetical protein n=1 Tax=Streptomyces longispororuber TaxID=68230 RepID=UPI0036F94B4C